MDVDCRKTLAAADHGALETFKKVTMVAGGIFACTLIGGGVYVFSAARPSISSENQAQMAQDDHSSDLDDVCDEVRRLDGKPPRTLADQLHDVSAHEKAGRPDLQNLFDLSCNRNVLR